MVSANWLLATLCVCFLAQAEAYRVVNACASRQSPTVSQSRRVASRPGAVLMNDEGPPPKQLNFFQRMVQGMDDLVDDVRASPALSASLRVWPCPALYATP
jgi:hypothetical protein